MPKRPSLFRLALYSLAPCLLFFGALELVSRVVENRQPPKAIDFSGGFSPYSRVFAPDPGKPTQMATNPAKAGLTFVAQNFPIRKAPDTFRIAALGESSVFHLQKEFQALERSLEKKLGFKHVQILNAGGQSYGSERLTLVARELLEYEPDMLFIYMGHNEFEEAEQLALIRPDLSGFSEAAFESSALVRLTVTALSSARIHALEEQHRMRVLTEEPNTTRAWRTQFTERDVENRMRTFRANLSRIIEQYKAKGVPVILSTVPSNLVKPYLPKESVQDFFPAFRAYKLGQFEESKRIARKVLSEAIGRHQSSDRENAILRELALSYQLPLLDVEALISRSEPHGIPGETLFADHCHLNARGNSILAEALEAMILKIGPTAR